jgi:hypothetical protein|tara:strand:- start:6646 stop:7101 length:456 start_codon:yes stop_codon:yes gene_type:complete
MIEQIDASINNIDISNNSNTLSINQTKQEELLALRKKQIDTRKEELVQVICRQTELTEIEAKQQLEDNQYDCMKVLNKYFGIENTNNESVATSANQMIYGEIRNLMDTGSKQYRMGQEKNEYLEKVKNLHEQQKKKQLTQIDSNMLTTVIE